MTQHHRYTGPELSRLLDQVRDELGREATILEANKVRSGGVAGFFAKENFEVVATAHSEEDDPAIRLDPDEPPSPERSTLDSAPRDSAMTSAAAPVATSPNSAVAAPRKVANGADGGGGVSTALLERADAISIQERIELSRTFVREDTVVDLDSSTRSFDAVLAEEMRQSEVSVTSPSTDDFWSRFDVYERTLTAVNEDRRLVAIVGNATAALTVSQMLAASTVGQERALLLVSDEEDVADLRSWQMVGRVGQLAERLRIWSEAERSGTVIIDSRLGPRINRFVDRIRRDQPGQVRLAIDGEVSPRRVFDLMQTLGGEVVVDLTFRPSTSYLMDLIQREVPVVSVAGRPLDAGLMLAIAGDAERG